MKDLALLFTSIFLFGISSFFRKMAVDHIHPYQLQIVAGAVYALEIPLWLFLLSRQEKQLPYDPVGVGWGVLTIVTHVAAAVLFGILLKTTASPGAASIAVSMSPLITLVLCMAFLGEQLTIQKFFACCLMLAGLLLFEGK